MQGIATALNAVYNAKVKRDELLSRPDEIDNVIAREIDFLQPVVKRVDYSKYPDKMSAIDAAVPDGHPMKGFAQKVRSTTADLLARPEFMMDKPRDVALSVAKNLLVTPGEDGSVPLENAYKYKREADSQLLQFGEDKKVRQLPGYQDWLTGKRAGEDAKASEESWLASPKDLAEQAAAGAVFGGAVGLVGGLPGAVVGAASDALLMAGLEIPLHPVKKLLEGTEWYRARNDSGKLIDKVKLLGADLLLNAGGMIGIQKAVPKALKGLAEAGVMGDEAASVLGRFPTASNAIKAGAIARRTKELSEGLDKAVMEDVDPKGILYDIIERNQRSTTAAIPGEGMEDFRMLRDYTAKVGERVKASKATVEDSSGVLGDLTGSADEGIKPIDLFNEVGVKAPEAPKIPDMFNQKARDTFKAFDDDTAELALQDAERGTPINDAIEKASQAKEAFKESYTRSELWQSGATPDNIERAWIKGNAKRLADQEAAKALREKASESIVGSIPKEVPEIIESEKLGTIAQKTVDNMQVSQLKADIEARSGGNSTLLKMLAPLAVGSAIGLGTLFGQPETSEAGIVSATLEKAQPILKAVVEKGLAEGKVINKEKFAETALKMGWISPGVDPLNPCKFVPRMEGITVVNKEIVKGAPKTTPFRIDKGMSPAGIDNMAYAQGAHASTELGSRHIAAGVNIDANTQVVRNIFDRVPNFWKTQADGERQSVEAFRPFIEKYSDDRAVYRALEARTFKVENEVIPGLKAKIKKFPDSEETIKGLQEAQGSIGKMKAEMERLQPAMDESEKVYHATAQAVAERYPSVRVFYAAEDTKDFTKYPWLKGMVTPEEKVAAAHLQNFNNEYAVALKAAGHDPITTTPYMHYAWHPDWKADTEVARRLENLGPSFSEILPYSKFFQRSKYSRPMVPDAWYSMKEYIPDTEKRLMWSKFWDKKNPNGWAAHKDSMAVQSNPVLRDYWNRIKESEVPAASTTFNTWANRIAAFETLRLIGGSPSAAFKHLFKNTRTWSNLGIREAIGHVPESLLAANRGWARKSADRGLLKALGIQGPGLENKTIDDMFKSFSHVNKLTSIMGDLDIGEIAKQGYGKSFDEILRTLNNKGSSMIAAVEAFDRKHSVLAALEMAQKSGMTHQQAMYGIYDTILKNNFLGGPLNPSWMRNPGIRLLTLFQNTPFKIWEQRLTAAYQTGRAVKLAGQKLKGSSLGDVLQQMVGLKTLVKEGEEEFKKNLILDALNTEKDFFGTPIAKQLVKDMIISGTVLAGGGMLGLNLAPQVAHLPFFNFERQEPTLRTAPIVNGIFKTMADRHTAKLNDEEPNFFVTSFLKSWLGGNGVIPIAAYKAMRITENDIPEIYRDSPLQYLFSVPSNTLR